MAPAVITLLYIDSVPGHLCVHESSKTECHKVERCSFYEFEGVRHGPTWKEVVEKFG